MSFNYNIFKSAAAAALMCTSLAVMADNTVYINDFTISDYEVTEVPVYLENTENLWNADWRITLPAGVQVNGTVKQANRLPAAYQKHVKVTPKADGTTEIYFLYATIDFTKKTFISPDNSPVAYIPVQAAPGALDKDATETIKVWDIALSNMNAQEVMTTTSTTSTVTLKRNVAERVLSMTCTNAPVVVNPGDKRQASLGMNNSYNVKGLQFDLYVPEHTSLSDFALPEELQNAGWMMTVADNNLATKGYMRVVMVGMTSGIPAGTNEVVTFNIAADSEFNSTADIRIDNIRGSDNKGVETFGAPVAFEVVSGQIALEQAMLALSEGDNSLANYITSAMNTISSECPLVADRDEFNMMPYFNKVQDLMAAAEKGYEDYTLTPDFESIVTVPATQVRTEVDALVAAAKSAQAAEEKRRADNKSAYDADMAAIAGLRQALEAAKEEVRKDYPDYIDEEAENDILDKINAMTAAADAEYKSVADEGNYDYKPDVEPVLNAISGLVPAAAERFRVGYNDNLYDADMEKLADLQKMYEEGIAEVREKNPSFDGDAMVEADIEAARSAVEAEYARVKDAGFYEAPAFDYASIADAIEAMVKEGLMTGIEVNIADIDLNGAEIYTLDGRRHNAPVKGQINVIRNQNSVIKVVVK